jgi:hypothetical protein
VHVLRRIGIELGRPRLERREHDPPIARGLHDVGSPGAPGPCRWWWRAPSVSAVERAAVPTRGVAWGARLRAEWRVAADDQTGRQARSAASWLATRGAERVAACPMEDPAVRGLTPWLPH